MCFHLNFLLGNYTGTFVFTGFGSASHFLCSIWKGIKKNTEPVVWVSKDKLLLYTCHRDLSPCSREKVLLCIEKTAFDFHSMNKTGGRRKMFITKANLASCLSSTDSDLFQAPSVGGNCNMTMASEGFGFYSMSKIGGYGWNSFQTMACGLFANGIAIVANDNELNFRTAWTPDFRLTWEEIGYVNKGVIKRCRLSWLINSALAYELKNAGGLRGLSQGVYSCAHGAQINFGDLRQYLTYYVNGLIYLQNRCRDPSRHFFFQSRRLLTKIFNSEVIGNWKCRCCGVKGKGHKTGVAERVICLSPP